MDDNKAIDMDELRALIVDIPQRYSVDPDQIPTPEETDLVMAALDADGNGSIDYAEWEHWVLSNHFLSNEDRANFASLSNTHAKFDRLIRSFVRIAIEKMDRMGGDRMIEGLKMLFNEFDADGDGIINMDELRAMMIAIPKVHNLGGSKMLPFRKTSAFSWEH